MVYLSKEDAKKIIQELSKTKNEELLKIVNKMKHPKKTIYVREKSEIRRLLKKAFREKKKVKIKDYSLSSDEVNNRIIGVYQMHKDCIIAYCYLRNEERTFVIDRIISAIILNEKYNIPKNWSPGSIITN